MEVDLFKKIYEKSSEIILSIDFCEGEGYYKICTEDNEHVIDGYEFVISYEIGFICSETDYRLFSGETSIGQPPESKEELIYLYVSDLDIYKDGGSIDMTDYQLEELKHNIQLKNDLHYNI